MSPINSIPCKLCSKRVFYRRTSNPFGSDDGGSLGTDRNRNSGNKGDSNDDGKGDNNQNNHNSNDDEQNGNNSNGVSNNNGGGSNDDGGSRSNGGGSNNDGGNDGSTRIPSRFSSTLITVRQSTAQSTPTAQTTFTTTFIIAPPNPPTSSESSTAPFLPTSTISTSTILPDSPPENALMTPTPSSVTQDTRHILPLGSIVAIILGILFCITIAGVIFVITRPRFGSLARLWKDSRTPGSYFPSTVASFEPKQQRDSSNLYRRYSPVQRPSSRTLFDLQAFRFGTAGNSIGQGSTISHQHNNLVASNIAGKYNDFQAHQIYSTGMPPPSAVLKPASRSISSETSKQPTYSSISSRIMSMMDAFSDSGVGSGRTSLKSYNWRPPRNDPASEGHNMTKDSGA